MIGLFGLAADPPHVGHLMAAVYALSMDSRIGLIKMVPTARHPWKPDLKTSFEDRVNMLRLLLAPLETMSIEIDGIEADLAEKTPDKPVYTYDVVEAYRARGTRVALVLGEDEAKDLPRWHRYDDLIRLTGSPCVVPRGSAKGMHCDVSSSMIRELLVRDKMEEAKAFVPGAILDYIEAHRLYMPSKWSRKRG